jgi:tetratricopeptide (TPR) repeat protein
MVLDTSKEQSERAREHLTELMTLIGAAAAILAFFGFREIKSIGTPYKEKLEALRLDYENKLNAQIEEFREKSHNNARALVASQLTWNLLEQAKKLQPGTDDAGRITLFQAVVDHVNKALPADYVEKLDTYLAGLLLMRKAFALKRLGDCEGAFDAAVTALQADGSTSRSEWAYNAACYAALSRRVKECCELLDQAVRLDPSNRQDAKSETDFDSVRGEPGFIAIVGA